MCVGSLSGLGYNLRTPFKYDSRCALFFLLFFCDNKHNTTEREAQRMSYLKGVQRLYICDISPDSIRNCVLITCSSCAFHFFIQFFLTVLNGETHFNPRCYKNFGNSKSVWLVLGEFFSISDSASSTH